jgi:hypothetical protein
VRLRNCIDEANFPCYEISRMPLAYLLNSIVLIFLGIKTKIDDRLWIVVINLLFIIAPIIAYRIQSKNFDWRNVVTYYVAVLLTAIPSFYLYTGGLELQFGVVLGIFLLSLSNILREDLNTTKLVYIILTISCLTLLLYKDTNYILIGSFLIIITVNLYKNILNIERNKNYKLLLCILIPFIIGILLSFLYNYTKKGTILPVEYVSYAAVFPTPYRSLKYFLATIFSPNGGIIFFWGLSLSLIFGFYYIKLLSFYKYSFLISFYVVLFFILGHSFWSGGGFGWYSWGSRYMVPPLLAFIICMTFSSKFVNLELDSISNQQSKSIKIKNVIFILCAAQYRRRHSPTI